MLFSIVANYAGQDLPTHGFGFRFLVSGVGDFVVLLFEIRNVSVLFALWELDLDSLLFCCLELGDWFPDLSLLFQWLDMQRWIFRRLVDNIQAIFDLGKIKVKIFPLIIVGG